jgi:hypothetical protein
MHAYSKTCLEQCGVVSRSASLSAQLFSKLANLANECSVALSVGAHTNPAAGSSTNCWRRYNRILPAECHFLS